MKPPAFLSKLLKTTDVLVQTWAFHLEQVEGSDLERVAMDREPSVKLPSPEMMRDAELAAGGETIYSRYTEDEPMPLYAFDRRACDRLATIRALGQLVEEVQALTPQTALECDFLRREAKADDDDENVDERIAERRRIRREKREAAYVGGDELAKAGAARDAALTFLEQFGNKWIPKLLKGDERSDLQLAACRKPGMPMQMLNRPPAAGVDADAVLEDLWSYVRRADYFSDESRRRRGWDVDRSWTWVAAATRPRRRKSVEIGRGRDADSPWVGTPRPRRG